MRIQCVKFYISRYESDQKSIERKEKRKRIVNYIFQGKVHHRSTTHAVTHCVDFIKVHIQHVRANIFGQNWIVEFAYVRAIPMITGVYGDDLQNGLGELKYMCYVGFAH